MDITFRLRDLATAVRNQLDQIKARLTRLEAGGGGGGGGGAWGSITGTLSAQTDLQGALDAKQAVGSYLTGNQSITLSGDAAGAGATAISVTLSTVNGSPGTFGDATHSLTATVDAKGRVTALASQLVTPAFASLTAKPTTVAGYGITDALTSNQTITLSGDLSGSGATSIAATIGNGAVSLAKMANMATGSVIYRKTAGAGVPEVQTLATLKTDLGLTGTNSGDQTITLTGDVTGSGTGSFATAIGANKVARSMLAAASGATLLGATAAGNVADLTAAQAKTFLAIAESDVANLTTDLAAKAPLASPTLTGTPAAPTAAAGTNTTQIATTAFVATGFAPLASPQFTGVSYYQQPAPTALSASATLTIAQMLTLIITATSTTAVSLTLPTGTLTDAGILSGALAVNEAFEWYVINLGSSSGAVTMVAGTGHTIVGSATVAIATSARFLTRKTATNTFVTYRIA